MPVLAVGSEYFIGTEVKNQMDRVSDNVKYVQLDCGHSMALERPQELAEHLIEFFKD
jgi:pimeloyl-ACP methyl ester carboxylesterase